MTSVEVTWLEDVLMPDADAVEVLKVEVLSIAEVDVDPGAVENELGIGVDEDNADAVFVDVDAFVASEVSIVG